MSLPEHKPRIFHPTDLSEASHGAFVHALKFAIASGSELDILHVEETEGEISLSDFPQVRRTLEQWNEHETQVHVSKLVGREGDPVSASLSYLASHPADLVVLATHQYSSATRWLHDKVAEPIARGSGEPTLFLPRDGTGFVSDVDGSIDLHRILIPIDHEPDPRCAIEAAADIAALLECENVEFTTLHIGPAADAPVPVTPKFANWHWQNHLIEEPEHDVVDEIAEMAKQTNSELIVMTTAGHHGFLDALRGTTTERVLRNAPCPVLAVPEDG